MPADTRERHAIVSRLAGRQRTVLDVGGVAGELDAFMPSSDVTALNLEREKADRHFSGGEIPFPDDSFDLAVSLDVIEHVAPEDRLGHLRELKRVARTRIVVCCPLGTDAHIEAERSTAAWYREVTGEPHRFLEEHLRNGLPTEEELRELAADAGLRANLLFHGDFESIVELFRRGTMAKLHPRPSTLTAYARLRLSRPRRAELSENSLPTTNRAFLVADVA